MTEDSNFTRSVSALELALSRRRFLARAGGTVAGLGALGVLAAACGGDSGSSTSGGATTAAAGATSSGGSSAGETINILTWEGYHQQPWLDEFEKQSGVKVNVTNVGSPAEMFAKTQAAPDAYDIVYATAGWFDQYVNADLVIPVDETKVANLSSISSAFPWRDATSIGGQNYGVLYNWGNQPLVWITDKVTGTPTDWNELWDPKYKGLVSVFDDPTSVQPMIPLALGFPDPYQLDDAQFEQFRQKLFELRPQVKRLTSGFNDQVNQFASGEAVIGYLNIIQVVVDLNAKNIQAKQTVPIQGTPAWSDNAAITKAAGAKKLDAVYEWINASIAVPFQARFAGATGNNGVLPFDLATSPEAVAAGLSADKLKITQIPDTQAGDAFFSKMIFFKAVEDLQKRLDTWNEFKLGIG